MKKKILPTAALALALCLTLLPAPAWAEGEADQAAVTDQKADQADQTAEAAEAADAADAAEAAEAADAADAAEAAAADHEATCPSRQFRDLETDAWYHEYVDYVLEHELMNGYSDGTFRPDVTLSRAHMVQILYNAEGRPEAAYDGAFPDVPETFWCAGAVAWAAESGVVSGGEAFRPDVPITREELAVMLYRYAQYKGMDVSVGEDTNILSYADFQEISEDAIPAFQWATGSGVLGGYSDGTLRPKGAVTRAQAAAMLARFMELE